MAVNKLLSYTAQHGKVESTIHVRMSIPLGDVGIVDIPMTNTAKELLNYTAKGLKFPDVERGRVETV